MDIGKAGRESIMPRQGLRTTAQDYRNLSGLRLN